MSFKGSFKLINSFWCFYLVRDVLCSMIMLFVKLWNSKKFIFSDFEIGFQNSHRNDVVIITETKLSDHHRDRTGSHCSRDASMNAIQAHCEPCLDIFMASCCVDRTTHEFVLKLFLPFPCQILQSTESITKTDLSLNAPMMCKATSLQLKQQIQFYCISYSRTFPSFCYRYCTSRTL